MPAWLAAALPAAISAGASIFGAERSNRLNLAEAQRNRNFQERMRSTEWQAGVEDMRAAGLNPALAYQQGGASSPGGSMASTTDALTPGVNSALQATMARKNLELLREQISKTQEETARTKEETREARFRQRRAGIAADFDTARFLHFFNQDGTAKAPLLKLFTSEVDSAVGSSAFSLEQARNLRFTTDQQKEIVQGLSKLGVSDSIARILAPFITSRGR